MIFLPSLALLALQNPAPPPAAPQQDPAIAGKPWVPYDRVMMIVNQDMITELQVWRDLRAWDRESPTKDPGELSRRQQEILTKAVTDRLKIQAGQDIGLDEKLVERNVQDRLQRLIESKGGAVAFSKNLEEFGQSMQDVRKSMREQLYASVWKDSVTGDSTAGARSKVDRYVRPGLLAFHFNNVLQKPEVYAAYAGKRETFTLQSILLDTDSFGGADATMKLALEIKKRIESGEDMSALVETYNPGSDKKGLNDPADLGALTRFNASIGAFAGKAKVGDVSDVITEQRAGKTRLRIVRLVDHTAAAKPDFSKPEVQAKITETVQKDLEDYRVGRALQVLLKASYVWPKELNQQP